MKQDNPVEQSSNPGPGINDLSILMFILGGIAAIIVGFISNLAGLHELSFLSTATLTLVTVGIVLKWRRGTAWYPKDKQ